jgi:hypothetical protein
MNFTGEVMIFVISNSSTVFGVQEIWWIACASNDQVISYTGEVIIERTIYWLF